MEVDEVDEVSEEILEVPEVAEVVLGADVGPIMDVVETGKSKISVTNKFI